MNSMQIRWLHLSDFHSGKDSHAQERIYEYILNNIREKIDSGLAPHLIFLTGDIGNRGLASDYEVFNRDLMLKLKPLVEDSCRGRIFVVPGNHDVNRKANEAFTARGVLGKVQTFLDPTSDGQRHRQILFPRFQNFVTNDLTVSDTTDHWLVSKSGALIHREQINGVDVGVLGVNTAWLSEEGEDRHKLSPGLNIVEHGLRKLEQCDIRFVIGHHPIDWLIDDEVQPCKTQFARHNVIFLHGHIHKNQSNLGWEAGEEFPSIQSGCCFNTRNFKKRAPTFLWSALDLGGNRVLMQPLKWSFEHYEWKTDVDAFSNAQEIVAESPWRCHIPACLKGLLPKSRSESGESESQSSIDSIVKDELRYPEAFNITRERNPYFRGRDELLARLREALTWDQPVALTSTQRIKGMSAPCLTGEVKEGRKQALVGLGGVGKTEMAIQYAYKYMRDYRIVWWISAEQTSTIVAAYRELAKLISDLGNLDEASSQEIREIVRRWLERNDEWLLIFDNVQEPAHIRDYLPRVLRGHVIITSRYPHWGTKAHSITVDILPRKAAVQFLNERSGDEDPEAAEKLATELGCLALALEHAAAYVETTGCGLVGYLERFRLNQAAILDIVPESAGDLPTVGSTWKTAFDRINERSRAAADLLKLISFLDPDSIQRVMLQQGADALDDGECRDTSTTDLRSDDSCPTNDIADLKLSYILRDTIAFDRLIATIKTYSLIKTAKDSISVHRLVQAATRLSLNLEERKKWAERAVSVVQKSMAFDPEATWKADQFAEFVPHALVVTEHAYNLETDFNNIDRLLETAGRLSYLIRDLESALYARERVLEIRTKMCQSNDTAIASAVSRLGHVYYALGDLDRAKDLFTKSLEIDKKIRGTEDPKVAARLTGIGNCYKALGDLDRAENLLLRALEINECVNGKDHSLVGTRLNDLGLLYREKGDLSRAEKHLSRALDIATKADRNSPVKTAIRSSNLGLVYREMGDLYRALDLILNATDTVEKLYGKEHYKLELRFNNLGLVYADFGDLDVAHQYLSKALKCAERAYGKDHLRVANRLRDFSPVLKDIGDLHHAKELIDRALQIDETVYGNDHPKVGRDLCYLADVMEALGEIQEAEKSVELSLNILAGRYGTAHRHYGTALMVRGKIFRKMGRLDEAINCLQQAMGIYEKTYGRQCFRTAEPMIHLGLAIADSGTTNEGRRLCEEALEVQRKALGSDHFKTRQYEEIVKSIQSPLY